MNGHHFSSELRCPRSGHPGNGTSPYWLSGLLLVAWVAGGCHPGPVGTAEPPRPRASVALEGWGAEAASDDWPRANVPRTFTFPRDHGAHRDFRIEWWYYTGNLFTEDGRRFGYQLTFFRTGIRNDTDSESRWAVRDLYTAHFAVSDVANRRLIRFERTNRAGIGWAGADETPGRIWNGSWQLQIDNEQGLHRLEAREQDVAIALDLMPSKPPVPHGEGGLSRKGPTDGNASYYYSFTRMKTSGSVTVDGRTIDVTGESWMDHEFSSSFLEKGQEGWDWFSIQLDDGTELMLYQIRRDDGTADDSSSGTLVAADGSVRYLTRDQFELHPTRPWHSPRTEGVYPQRWRVTIPSAELEFEVQAVFEDQEMDTRASTGIVYWEGCVDVTGSKSGSPISGRGYLEMTGRRK